MPSARSATAAPRRHARTSKRPRRTARPTPLRRIRWDRIGRVGLLVVLIVVAGLYVQQALAYLSVRGQASQQRSIVHGLQRDNATLASQQRSLRSPETIEREARSLGMVRMGERPYVITGLQKH
jgi:cell division protein FtsB